MVAVDDAADSGPAFVGVGVEVFGLIDDLERPRGLALVVGLPGEVDQDLLGGLVGGVVGYGTKRRISCSS